jgi:regulator of sigma E protease
MLDEREATLAQPIPERDLERAFNRKPIWKRALIVVAGPVANLLLAVAIYAALAMHGSEEPAATIANPAADSIGARAGLSAGDRIVSVDGTEIASFDDLRWQLMQAAVDRRVAELVVDHEGSTRPVELDLRGVASEELKGDFTDRIGFTLRTPRIGIGHVEDGSAAQRGGLRAEDVIVSIDGEGIDSNAGLRDRIRAAVDRPVRLGIERGVEHFEREIVPDRVVQPGSSALVGVIGVQLDPRPDMVEVRRDLIPAIRLGVQRTWETATFALRMLGKMLIGQVSLSNLSGPVTIADYAGQTARIGLEAYLAFVAAISISIGVLNLLPIPMLDGGHLLYHLIEAFKGRPLSERFIDLTQRAGLGILVMLMAVALFNDLSRLLA